MERVERFADLAPLLSAQLKKGVFTNNFLRPDDYDREIAGGLWVHAHPGGLLLLRARDSHYVLNFYLQRDGALELPALDKPAVTELVCALAWIPAEAPDDPGEGVAVSSQPERGKRASKRESNRAGSCLISILRSGRWVEK